jgi:pyruvate kinase
MVEVCLETEANLPERVEYHDRGGLVQNVSGATGFSAVQAARLVGAKALLCPTLSGRTARIMSAFRPRLPIIATAPIDLVLRRSCFYWGVECIMVEEKESLTRICYDTIKQARIQGYLEIDDVVVITAGDPVTSPMAEVGMPTAETATNAVVIAQAF